MLLNCDMGEAFGAWTMGQDEQIMPYVDQANIACGFHASDPLIMAKTVSLAKQHSVSVGAHPGFPDLVGFGRRKMDVAPAELKALVQYQVGALQGICQAQGMNLSYVKPHGALYNQMASNEMTLDIVMQAVSEISETLPLMVMAVPEREAISRHAERYGLTILYEAFADRLYTADGRLTPRSQADAVHSSVELIEQQVLGLLQRSEVTTETGQALAVNADSICIHGDNPHALEAVKRVRRLLQG